MKKLGLIGLALACVVMVGAGVANVTSDWSDGELVFKDVATGTSIMTIKDSTGGVNIHLATDLDGTLNVDGAATLATVDINAGAIDGTIIGAGSAAAATVTDLTRRGETLTLSSVSLTSPTVIWSAANKGLVTLNSDSNQTGIYPTGGALYQVVTIVSGAGSNTMQFDDGTSMTIGANVTLTEAQNDALTLMCVSSDGDEWTALSAHSN